MGRYDGKTVVITGGTSGMGLATAKLFVAEGARVLATGRTAETIESARAELGRSAAVVASDAASLGDIRALAARAKEELGEIDLLFLNAGLGAFAPLESMTEATFDAMFTLNAKGPYFAVQSFAPSMRAATVDQLLGQSRQDIPMRRVGRTEEIASAVAFLGFEATYTTGAELPVDGGWSQL